MTAASAGCTVISGATSAAVTARVAVELVTLPWSLLTTTRTRSPFWPSVVAAIAYPALVIPAMGVKVAPASTLDCHW